MPTPENVLAAALLKPLRVALGRIRADALSRLQPVQLHYDAECARIEQRLLAGIVTLMAVMLTVQFLSALLVMMVWGTPWCVAVLFLLVIISAVAAFGSLRHYRSTDLMPKEPVTPEAPRAGATSSVQYNTGTVQ